MKLRTILVYALVIFVGTLCGCASNGFNRPGVFGPGVAQNTSDGPSQIGAASGGVAVHRTATGVTEVSGNTTPPDNIVSVNPDNSYHASSTLPGTRIIFDQLIYDGVADLKIGRAEAEMNPETGALVSVRVENVEAIRSEPIRADAEVLDRLKDMTLGLSADQRATIEATVPGLLDIIAALLRP